MERGGKVNRLWCTARKECMAAGSLPLLNRANTPSMTDHLQARFVGRSVLRREDRRLLMGQGQFIADVVLPRMLHTVFVRSPVAHARIRSVDISRAASAPGVALALSGAELARLLPPVPDSQLSLPSKWRALVEHKLHNPQQPLLAMDKVRHVGEAIAVVVAESHEAAEDAAELVQADFEPLPAVVDPEAALRAGTPLVHERLGTNLIGEFSIGGRRSGSEAGSSRHVCPVLRVVARESNRFHTYIPRTAVSENQAVLSSQHPHPDSQRVPARSPAKLSPITVHFFSWYRSW